MCSRVCCSLCLAKSPVTGTKSPTSMTNSKVTTTSLKTNLCTCPICDDLIEERSEMTPGHDAIHCDGICDSWLHRRCTGLSKSAFLSASNSDSVPHNNLLIKLWSCGINGNLWLLFKAYLTSRKLCVSINHHSSNFLPVLSGVPQGSILGPLLFLIYISDLPSAVSFSELLSFADDTKCFKCIQNLDDCTNFQLDLSSLQNWSNNNHLLFNVLKFVHISFHSHPPHTTHSYHVDNNTISLHSHHKDFGIIISSDLSWNNHYNYISSRAYKLLGLLRRSFSSINSQSGKKLLYISLIRSQLSYCSQIWRPHLLKDIQSLEQIQRRATKFILNDYDSDYKSLLQTLHLLPLTYRFELNDILFFINSIKNPPRNFNILHYLHFTKGNTRSSSYSKLVHSSIPTNTGSHFYFIRFPRLWNSLPPLDLTLSANTLKNTIINFFWSNFSDNFDSSNPCSYHFLCPCSKCSSTPSPPNFHN